MQKKLAIKTRKTAPIPMRNDLTTIENGSLLLSKRKKHPQKNSRD